MSTQSAPVTNAIWLSVEAIEENPYQPRKFFDAAELQELADSIKEHGVIQPILVRPNPHLEQACLWNLSTRRRRTAVACFETRGQNRDSGHRARIERSRCDVPRLN